MKVGLQVGLLSFLMGSMLWAMEQKGPEALPKEKMVVVTKKPEQLPAVKDIAYLSDDDSSDDGFLELTKGCIEELLCKSDSDDDKKPEAAAQSADAPVECSAAAGTPANKSKTALTVALLGSLPKKPLRIAGAYFYQKPPAAKMSPARRPQQKCHHSNSI